MKSDSQLIYIVGRGHSGSTILDILLGNSPDIESVGELVSGMGRYKASCSCGLSFVDCGYWQSVRNRYTETTGQPWDTAVADGTQQAHVRQFPSTLLGSRGRFESLIRSTNGIVAAVCAEAGKPMMLDSSKEATRALFLARFYSRSRIIHLTRHPYSILCSNHKRIVKGQGFKYLRRMYKNRRLRVPLLILSSVSWFTGNLLAEVVRAFAPKRYLRVRYEDLCNHSERELGRIGRFLGVDLEDLIEKVRAGSPLPVGHNIGGNRIRRSATVQFDSESGTDQLLPFRYKALAALTSWPLLLRYGYRLDPPGVSAE